MPPKDEHTTKAGGTQSIPAHIGFADRSASGRVEVPAYPLVHPAAMLSAMEGAFSSPPMSDLMGL